MGLHLHIGSVVPEMDEKKGNIRAEVMRGVLRDDKVHIPDVMCLGRRHLLARAQRSSSKRGAHSSLTYLAACATYTHVPQTSGLCSVNGDITTPWLVAKMEAQLIMSVATWYCIRLMRCSWCSQKEEGAGKPQAH